MVRKSENGEGLHFPSHFLRQKSWERSWATMVIFIFKSLWSQSCCRAPDDPFWGFLSPGMQEPLRRCPEYHFLDQATENKKKNSLGIRPKKLFHSFKAFFGRMPKVFFFFFSLKAFDLLCKFETRWTLIGGLSRGFFIHLRDLQP